MITYSAIYVVIYYLSLIICCPMLPMILYRFLWNEFQISRESITKFTLQWYYVKRSNIKLIYQPGEQLLVLVQRSTNIGCINNDLNLLLVTIMMWSRLVCRATEIWSVIYAWVRNELYDNSFLWIKMYQSNSHSQSIAGHRPRSIYNIDKKSVTRRSINMYSYLVGQQTPDCVARVIISENRSLE